MLSDIDYVIFSVINNNYTLIAKEWARRVKKVSNKQVVFVCADKQSYDHLKSQGFECYDFRSEMSENKQRYLNTTFPNQHAAYTVSLKFKFAQYLVESGLDCIYCDVDAFWIRNPIPYLVRQFSVAFQPGLFPKDPKEKWGFSACTGFIAFRSDKNVGDLLSKAISCFDGSDQAAFNQVMLDDCAISWEKKPNQWEHCGLTNGWVEPVLGRCSITELSFLALPHSYFQRHNTTVENCDHAIICHPNSPKNQSKKIKIFQSLGLWTT